MEELLLLPWDEEPLFARHSQYLPKEVVDAAEVEPPDRSPHTEETLLLPLAEELAVCPQAEELL